MTDIPTLNGQDIGQAERATRALLDAVLAQTDTPFTNWVVLNMLANAGGGLERDELVTRTAGGLRIGAPAIVTALDELLTGGFVTTTDDVRIVLTADGEARFARIRAGVDRIAERLYGDLPIADLATAHRVLALVTERANAELAR
jgi:DNA-binding MarR family transcriptional regulator